MNNSKPVHTPVFERRLTERRHAKSVNPSSVDYQAGHTAGFAEAESLNNKVQAGLVNDAIDFKQHIKDLDFSYRDEISKLFLRMLDSVAPALSRLAVRAELVELIETHVVQNKQKIEIRSHPETASALNINTPSEGGVSFVADNSFAPDAIKVQWPGGGMIYDPGAFFSQLREILLQQNNKHKEVIDG